jgi:hypothetical protein
VTQSTAKQDFVTMLSEISEVLLRVLLPNPSHLGLGIILEDRYPSGHEVYIALDWLRLSR